MWAALVSPTGGSLSSGPISMQIPAQSQRGRRAPVSRANCVVESPDTAEPSRKGYLRQRHGRLIDQPFCRLNAPGSCDLSWRGARVTEK
jgi:hypothetical protein